MAQEAQAALEQAVLNTIRTTLSYTSKNSARTFDGEPPPACGGVFVAVWHEGSRGSESSGKTYLAEVFGVNVTVTLRHKGTTWDHWVALRDDMETRLNRISELISKDAYNHAVVNAANVLADFATSPGSATKAVGFTEALILTGYDDVRPVGPDWFKADLQRNRNAMTESGIAQTARFGLAKRYRGLSALV